MSIAALEPKAREAMLAELMQTYESYQQQKLALNMARGKPAPEQLDRVQQYYDQALKNTRLTDSSGTDCRNYGGLEGLPEMKAIFADIMETEVDDILVLGNSSLELMAMVIQYALMYGVPGVDEPWFKLEKRKFLCPAPGYDRHFALTEHAGFELILVPMTESGPDMDVVESLCANDSSIKGIWCVPKYSNPDGYVYSEETVKRLALMDAADDFVIMWDNAYAVHHLYADQAAQLPNLIRYCEAAGHPNRAVMFASTSKITYAGAGVSAVATSSEMKAWILDHLQYQTIGPNKVVQLQTLRLIEAAGGITALMAEHAEILKPKFERCLAVLEAELGDTGLATWYRPMGGYFVSVHLANGLAKKVVSMCKEAGVTLTGAGAAFPYKKDPNDSNIRIAPSFPTLDELDLAIQIFCTCVKIAALQA